MEQDQYKDVMQDIEADTIGLQATVREANITAQQLKAAAMLYVYYKHPYSEYQLAPMGSLEAVKKDIDYFKNFIAFLRDRGIIKDGGNW